MNLTRGRPVGGSRLPALGRLDARHTARTWAMRHLTDALPSIHSPGDSTLRGRNGDLVGPEPSYTITRSATQMLVSSVPPQSRQVPTRDLLARNSYNPPSHSPNVLPAHPRLFPIKSTLLPPSVTSPTPSGPLSFDSTTPLSSHHSSTLPATLLATLLANSTRQPPYPTSAYKTTRSH